MIKRVLQKKISPAVLLDRQENFSHMLIFVQRSKNGRVILLRRETLELLSGNTAGRNVYCNAQRFREGASSPNGQREENLCRVLRE